MKDLHNNLAELTSQRDAAVREISELKAQLKMVEEMKDNLRRELIEASKKMKEGKLAE